MKAVKNENGIFAINFVTSNGKERIVLLNSDLKCVGIFRTLDLTNFIECEMEDLTPEQIQNEMGEYASATKDYQRELAETRGKKQKWLNDCNIYLGKKLIIFEPITKTPDDFKKRLSERTKDAENFYFGSVTVTDSGRGRGGWIKYNDTVYNGLFYVEKSEIYSLNDGLIVSSRKKNYSTSWNKIEKKEFVKLAYKLEKERVNLIEKNKIDKFNSDLTKFALEYISKI